MPPVSRFIRLTSLTFAAVLFFVVSAPGATAQELIYVPTNPAFGGSPANYSWLLGSAQAQNQHEEQRDPFARDPFTDFEQNLQRQILNQLSRELIGSRFGDLDLSQPGQFDFGDFLVEIIPGLSGVSIRVFNNLTGEETIVTIPTF